MTRKSNSKFVKSNLSSVPINDTPLAQSLSNPSLQPDSDIVPDSISSVFPSYKETDPIPTHPKRNRSQSYSSSSNPPKEVVAVVKEAPKSKNKFSSTKSQKNPNNDNDDFQFIEGKQRSSSYQVLPKPPTKSKNVKQPKSSNTPLASIINQALMSPFPEKTANDILKTQNLDYIITLSNLSDMLRTYLSNLEQSKNLTRNNSLTSYGTIGRSGILGSHRSNTRVKTPISRSNSSQGQYSEEDGEGGGTSGLNINDRAKEVNEFARLLMDYYTETLSEVESLTSQKENMTSTINDLQRDREKLQKQIHMIQDQSENHENENLQLQQTREELLSENRDLRNHNTHRELKIKDQENKLLENKEEILKLKGNLVEKDKDFQKMKVRLESEIKAIRTRITEFQTQKGELEKKLKQSQEDNEIARKRIEELLQELHDSQSELNRSILMDQEQDHLGSPNSSPVLAPKSDEDIGLPQISPLEEQYKTRIEKLQKSRDKAKAQINRFKKERQELLKALNKLQEKAINQKQQIEILGGQSDDENSSEAEWDFNRKFDPNSIPTSPLESDEESVISNDGLDTPTQPGKVSILTKSSHQRLKPKSRQNITPPDISESEESDTAGPKMNPQIGSHAFNRSLFRKKQSINEQSFTLSQVLNGDVLSPKTLGTYPMNAYYRPDEKSLPNSPGSGQGTLLSDYLLSKDSSQSTEKLSDLVDTSLSKVLPKFSIQVPLLTEQTLTKSKLSQENLRESSQNLYRSESEYSSDVDGLNYYKIDSRLAANVESLTYQIISKLSPLLNKAEPPQVSESSQAPFELQPQISQENINYLKQLLHSIPDQEKSKIINIIKIIQPTYINNEAIVNLFEESNSGLEKLINVRISGSEQSKELSHHIEEPKDTISTHDHKLSSSISLDPIPEANENASQKTRSQENLEITSDHFSAQIDEVPLTKSSEADILQNDQEQLSIPVSPISTDISNPHSRHAPAPISTDEIVNNIQTDPEFQKNFVTSLSKLIVMASSKVESTTNKQLTIEDEKSVHTIGLIYEIFHSTSAQKVLNNYKNNQTTNVSSQDSASQVLEPSISTPSSDHLPNILQEIDEPSTSSFSIASPVVQSSTPQPKSEIEINPDLLQSSSDSASQNITSALGLMQPRPNSQATPPHPSQPLPPTPQLNSVTEANDENQNIEAIQTHSTSSTSPQLYGKLLELSSSKYVPLVDQNAHRTITATSPILASLTQNRTSAAIPSSITGDLDEAIILYSLTQTMVGEMMHKFVKYDTTRGNTTKCHQRFVWVHPYTKTINWSPYAPGPGQQTDMLGQTMHRSVYFKSIKVVKDPPEAIPPGACRYSIVLDTGKAKYKFKTSSKTRHDIWFTSLSFIQKHMPSRLADLTPASVNLISTQASNLTRSNTSDRPRSALSSRLSQNSVAEANTTVHLDRPPSSLSTRSNVSRPQSPARSLVSRGTHTLTKMLSKTSLNSLHFGNQSSETGRPSRRDRTSQV